MTFEEWKKTQFLCDAWGKPKTERHRNTWQASRENMQEYQKHDFCRDTECQDLLNADTEHETCLIGDNYPVCCRTAKHFHAWLKENGYRIVKGE